MKPAPPIVKQEGPDVLLSVHVQPRASRNQLVFSSDRISLRLTAPPVDGAANAACRAFLAERLDVAKSRIAILRGDAARAKLIRIREVDAADILSRLRSASRESGSRRSAGNPDPHRASRPGLSHETGPSAASADADQRRGDRGRGR